MIRLSGSQTIVDEFCASRPVGTMRNTQWSLFMHGTREFEEHIMSFGLADYDLCVHCVDIDDSLAVAMRRLR